MLLSFAPNWSLFSNRKKDWGARLQKRTAVEFPPFGFLLTVLSFWDTGPFPADTSKVSLGGADRWDQQ